MRAPEEIPNFSIKGLVVHAFAFDEDTPATTIARYVASPDQRMVLVTAPKSQRLIGIVTKDDMERFKLTEPPQQAKDIATKTIVAVRNDTSVWDALQILNGRNRLRRLLDTLPVVNDAGDALGVITRQRLEQTFQSGFGGSPSSLSY